MTKNMKQPCLTKAYDTASAIKKQISPNSIVLGRSQTQIQRTQMSGHDEV